MALLSTNQQGVRLSSVLRFFNAFWLVLTTRIFSQSCTHPLSPSREASTELTMLFGISDCTSDEQKNVEPVTLFRLIHLSIATGTMLVVALTVLAG